MKSILDELAKRNEQGTKEVEECSSAIRVAQEEVEQVKSKISDLTRELNHRKVFPS